MFLRFSALSCALMAAAVLVQPAAAAQGVRADTVRAAVLEDWPPHYGMDENGQPTGFAVDMMDAVAERAGLAVRYVRFRTFPDATEALADGRVDVIPDYGVVSFRTDETLFTRPFEAFRIAVFTRSSNAAPTVAAAVNGKRVAVVRANAALPLVREQFPEARLVVFNSAREALFELLAAGVDAAAYPEEVFQALARSVDVGDRIQAMPTPLAEVPRAMGVPGTNPALRDRLDRALEEVISSPEYEQIYRRWFTPPKPFWTVKRVGWASGVVLLVVLLAMGIWRYRDIARLTERLRRSLAGREAAEAARRREEHRFRTLVEAAYEGILVGGPDNRITFANQRAGELAGVQAEDLVGEPFLKFVAREHHERVEDGIRRRRQGASDSYEIRLDRPDEEEVWVLLSVAPILDEEGSFQGSVGTLTDISDLRRAEAQLRERERRFRAYVENATDLISTLDRQGRMGYQSPPLKKLLGYKPEQLRGQSVFDYIHEEDVAEVRAAWEHLIQAPDREMHLMAFRFRHYDGSWRTMEATLTNLLDDPAVGAVLSNARDVTEREELERKLRQSQKLEAIGRLAGGVAHDFNNLLTVISANAEFLTEGHTPSDPIRQHIDEIRQAAARGADLTRQLLAFSRDQVMEPRPTHLNDVVTAMERLLRRIIGEHIELRVDRADSIPPIEIDPGQLEQVIMNLAVNARDAMPNGGILEVVTAVVELDESEAGQLELTSAGPHVRLMVRDNGVGMDPATLDRIFEPFFTTKPQESGTGLGLATVHGVVRQSSGAIRLESEPGVGTTFYLYFPATSKRVEREGTVVTEVNRPDAIDSQGILVVEDDPGVRSVLQRTLTRSGFDVSLAGTVAEARRILDRPDHSHGLVLTDLVLPDASGLDLIDLIRADHPDIRVIAMSGYSRHEILEERVLGRDIPFLGKPFTPESVAAIVHTVLNDLDSG